MATTTTIRIQPKTHLMLKEIAEGDGISLTLALDRLVDEARRKRIVDRANASWAALREDPEAWAEYQAEIAVFDGAMADGLPTEPTGDW